MIRIHGLEQTSMDGWPAIVATVDLGRVSRQVYVRAQRGPLASHADPFLAAALVPAMLLNLPIQVEGTVSHLLLDHIDRIQDVFTAWYPDAMHRVEVRARGTATPLTEDHRVGVFFSGGIDSFYTALKHRSEISDLVFIHGFDIHLEHTARRQIVSARLEEAAAEMGKTLLQVETNVRDLLDPYADWRLHSHGPALGCVALALAPQFRRLYIAATHTYARPQLLASHPILDPLWGHETLEIVQDGGEWSRFPKAARTVTHPIVQRHLRVCWSSQDEECNCGRCDKCVGIMIVLRAVGVANQCTTFPPLDLSQVAEFDVKDTVAARQLTSLLSVAEEAGKDPALIEAIRQRLQRARDEGVIVEEPSPEIRRLQSEMATLKRDLKHAQAELQRIKTSRSWRLLAPLRALSQAAHSLHRSTRRR